MLEEASAREARDMRLLRRYRLRGDRRAHEELVRRFTPLVRSFARKYSGRGEEFEDLAQVGMVALLKAIEGFEFDRRRRFVAYAVPTITGEMKRHFRDHCWSVSVPRSMKELQTRLIAAEAQLDAAGRPITVAALAERLGVSEDEVVRAGVAKGCFRVNSLSFPSGEDREVLATLGEAEAGYDGVEHADVLRDALGSLSDRDRAVVSMRFFDGMLQREIGERVSVSQMQVSRIIEQSTRTMREHLEATDGGPVAA